MTSSIEHLARLLRVDKDTFAAAMTVAEQLSGKRGFVEQLDQKRLETIASRLQLLQDQPNARQVLQLLFDQARADEVQLEKLFPARAIESTENLVPLTQYIGRQQEQFTGTFLKLDVAERLLQANPPQKLLSFLSVATVDEALRKVDLLELFASLRFIEETEWLNKVFFEPYRRLSAADFERRPIALRVLQPLWRPAARQFVQKKYHPVSHLKELGLIFVVPEQSGSVGELTRTLSLLFHYLFEISFYSKVFAWALQTPASFQDVFLSALRGDVVETVPAQASPALWLLVQRYLVKEDEFDWRLFCPHVNLESFHWRRALRLLIDFLHASGVDFSFWRNLDWVGDYFNDEVGMPVVVSFNLPDVAMGLVHGLSGRKYTYHFSEALWTELFLALFENPQEREEGRIEQILIERLKDGYLVLGDLFR